MGDPDEFDLDRDVDWVSDRAAERARLLRGEEEIPALMKPHRLLRHVRYVLGFGVHEAVAGPLRGVISARRLRRTENGEDTIPPRIWEIYLALLLLARTRRDDLIAAIAQHHPEEPTPE